MQGTLHRTGAEIRTARQAHPEMRERDFARIHAISEGELLAAFCGHHTKRLRPDVDVLLNGLVGVGEVLALTRNGSAVHEKIGPYQKPVVGKRASMVLGELIDLRIFGKHWASGFAVEKTNEDGTVRRSLQFFDGEGNAVHKVHARPATDMAAWARLVEQLTDDNQSDTLTLVAPPEAEEPTGLPSGVEELRERWAAMTDTHQFFGMLKKLNLTRHQAMHMVGTDYAWPLEADSVRAMFDGAAAQALPIMVFVGNAGCIQIHSGPVQNIKTMGPWLNVMDETFHMHLRMDHIAEVWAVRKPTKDGHVTSLEAFGADKELIVQFFGKRVEGHDERPQWRSLVEGLGAEPSRSNAA